jgi:hypothetical protein
MTEAKEFKSLIGQKFVSIGGMSPGSDEVRFAVSDGRNLVMNHSQDCCEQVRLYSVDGDPADLLDSEIRMAEMVTEDAAGQKIEDDYTEDSATWTFYRFATVKGYVTLRWLGSSNGYYSESVSFFDEAKGDSWDESSIP